MLALWDQAFVLGAPSDNFSHPRLTINAGVAEAILELRALQSIGDFDEYRAFHPTRKRRRVPATGYAHRIIRAAA